MLRACAIIAIIISSLGLFGLTLIVINRRVKEIGIRKAIGATKSAITRQFLTEAVFICQIGGFIGLIVGVLVGNILDVVMESQVVFPWGAAVGGIIGLTFIGLLFGVFPAVKAARLDPIDALRYE